MASFSKIIKCKYGLSTYDEVKKSHEWIVKSIEKLNYKTSDIRVEFQFDIGDISCVVDSYSEFVEYGYGTSDFKLVSITFNLHDTNDKHIHISNYKVGNPCSLYVSAGNKAVLEKVCNSLLDTELVAHEEAPSITYIATQNNNNTNITGDNNVVVNQSKDVDINTTNEEKKKSIFKQWLIAIVQNLLSNWIWYLLTLLVAFIGYLIGTYQG